MTKTIKRMHLRIAIGGAILMIALFLWIYAGTSFAATAAGSVHAPSAATATAGATAIQVRYPEGTIHGFLDLRTASGELLAHGDLLQLAKNDGIESRMLFHLANSVFEETVNFTQRGVFVLQSYHLVQSGPLFAEDIDATITRGGAYIVTTKSHSDGHVKRYVGNIELPPDVYNGMVVTIAKNLPAGEGETIHIVAFTPQPRMINLELALAGTEHVLLGKHKEPASHLVLKPKLGVGLALGAKLKGEYPPDSHVWIVTDQVPAFVRYQGPMYSGPVWRIDLTSPSWPEPQ